MTLKERIKEIEDVLKLIDYSISGVIPNHEYETLYNIPELIQELQTKNKELEAKLKELKNDK